MDKYLISRSAVETSLASEHMTLEDYDATILGFVHDGAEWVLAEDSLLGESDALEWAERVAQYGELVGLYLWEG